MIKQITVLEFEKQNKKVQVICDPDTPLGVLFDCLMEAKGWTVERMVSEQKKELEMAEQYKKISDEEIEQGCAHDHC